MSKVTALEVDTAKRPKRDTAAISAAGKLRSALGRLATILEPGKAEPPILAASVRTSLLTWLTEIRTADDLRAVGLTPRASALLYGPPGCGKTTLAHHLAARLGIPMVVVGPETLQDMYLGQSERNVARLFDTMAQVDVPCLLFIDELDSLAHKRQGAITSGASEGRLAALTVLLRKVEEFRGFCIGATNRHDNIDPAMWRRFNMQISVDLPGTDERFAILRRYGLPYEFCDADLDLLADLTEGASPALLRGLMEGIKRSLVLWPRMNRGVDSAPEIVAAILAGLSPPPEIQAPPLWMPGRCRELDAMAWPPTLPVPEPVNDDPPSSDEPPA